LDRRKSLYIGGMLEMANARLYPFWGSLTEALRTGEPQNEAKRGGDLFGELYADPERLRAFLKAMTGLSLGPARAMAAKFPWRDHRTVIDIGCAEGGLPVADRLGAPAPFGRRLRPPASARTSRRMSPAHGLSDRLAFHAGDFFADPLPRADVLVMGHILHDWDLEKKRLLLAKAHEALPPGARSSSTRPSSTTRAGRTPSGC
jgi:hypothetical protein